MEKIRKGNLSEKIRIEGSHELWQLAEQYNHTVEALEEQREETKREYEEKTKMLKMRNAAEKEALESQINAHFLCNTIGAINYSAMENGDTEVSVLLKKPFRYPVLCIFKRNENGDIGRRDRLGEAVSVSAEVPADGCF